ncbi:hypothetical protein AB751O23_CZ_00010, partial [Chlamydiales bacterium SCGC AB-751-O23]
LDSYAEICTSLANKLIDEGKFELLLESLYQFNDLDSYAEICTSLANKLIDEGKLELLLESLYQFNDLDSYAEFCMSLASKLIEERKFEQLMWNLKHFQLMDSYQEICTEIVNGLINQGKYELLLQELNWFQMFTFFSDFSKSFIRELIRTENYQVIFQNLFCILVCDNLYPEFNDDLNALIKSIKEKKGDKQFLEICLCLETKNNSGEKFKVYTEFKDDLNIFVKRLIDEKKSTLFLSYLEVFSDGKLERDLERRLVNGIIESSNSSDLISHFDQLKEMNLSKESFELLLAKIKAAGGGKRDLDLEIFIKQAISFSFNNLTKNFRDENLSEKEENKKVKEKQNEFLLELFDQFPILKPVNESDKSSLKEILDVGNPTLKKEWVNVWVNVRLPSKIAGKGLKKEEVTYLDFLNHLVENNASISGKNAPYFPLLFPFYSRLLKDKGLYSEKEFSKIKENFFKVFSVLSSGDLTGTDYKSQLFSVFSSLSVGEVLEDDALELRSYNLIIRFFKPRVEGIERIAMKAFEEKKDAKSNKNRKKELDAITPIETVEIKKIRQKELDAITPIETVEIKKIRQKELDEIPSLEITETNTPPQNLAEGKKTESGLWRKPLFISLGGLLAFSEELVGDNDEFEEAMDQAIKQFQLKRGNKVKLTEFKLEMGKVDLGELLENDGSDSMAVNRDDNKVNKMAIADDIFRDDEMPVDSNVEMDLDNDFFRKLMETFINSDDDNFNFLDKLASRIIDMLGLHDKKMPELKNRLSETFFKDSEKHAVGFFKYLVLQKHLPELKRFLLSVLNKTFNDDRYQGSHFEKLEELKVGLKDGWKEADLEKELSGSINGQKCTIELAKDWRTIFLIGTEISGSCQNIYSISGYNR